LGSLQVFPCPRSIRCAIVQFSVSGSTLTLSWPTNGGWILQSQTNALNVGLTVNPNTWFDIPSTASVTSTNIPMNPANPTVFFGCVIRDVVNADFDQMKFVGGSGSKPVRLNFGGSKIYEYYPQKNNQQIKA